MATPQALTLFDIDPTGAIVTPPPALGCFWHNGEWPPSTHQLVTALNLIDPWWWSHGGLHPNGGIRSSGGDPLHLYRHGTTVCTDCAHRDAGHGLDHHPERYVRHYIPLQPAA